jgi:hypothetical protein
VHVPSWRLRLRPQREVPAHRRKPRQSWGCQVLMERMKYSYARVFDRLRPPPVGAHQLLLRSAVGPESTSTDNLLRTSIIESTSSFVLYIADEARTVGPIPISS